MAQAAMSALNFAKQNKLASRGLQGLAGHVKNRTFKSILRAGAAGARALGFGAAIGTVGSRSRQGRKGKRRARNAGVSAQSGASTVGAGNAPVQFARTDQLKPYFNVKQGDCEDSVIVHSIDLVGSTGQNATGVFSCLTTLNVSPGNATMHPWLATMAALFQRYKLKWLRLHYQHFAGTSVAGNLMLQYVPDADFNGGTLAITKTQAMNMSNYMVGALYEDFYHTVDLHGIDKDQWYNTAQVQPGTDDPNSLFAGLIGVYSSDTAAPQVATGNFWVEAVYELNARKLSTITIGFDRFTRILNSKLDRETKLEYLRLAGAAMLRDHEKEQEDKRKLKARNDTDQLCIELDELRVVPTEKVKVSLRAEYADPASGVFQSALLPRPRN